MHQGLLHFAEFFKSKLKKNITKKLQSAEYGNFTRIDR